jgi:hypothetical protein
MVSTFVWAKCAIIVVAKLTPKRVNKIGACSTIRSLAGLSNSERGGCIVLGVLRIVSTPIQLYRKSSIFCAMSPFSSLEENDLSGGLMSEAQ